MRFLILWVCVTSLFFPGCRQVFKKPPQVSVPETTPEAPSPQSTDPSQEKLAVKEIFLKHRMAVFKVETNFSGPDNSASGSGFIIDRQDHGDGTYTYTVMTNAHVVDERLRDVMLGKTYDELGWELTTADEEQTFDEVRLVGLDPIADLTLLSFKTRIPDLPVCELGESENVKTLDDVVVIGNALGVGVIPTTGRINDPHKGANDYPFDVMQTDASIAGGNSGGPVFSLYGKVIGVVFQKYNDMDGALVIPISRARKSLENMRRPTQDPKVVYGWWGIQLEPLEPKIRKRVVPQEIGEVGVEVVRVYLDSPASKAGIRPGDIILEVNGDRQMTHVTTLNKMYKIWAPIYDSRKGDSFALKLYRWGEGIVDVRLTAEEKGYGRVLAYHTPFGFTVYDISETSRLVYEVPEEVRGVWVRIEEKERGVLYNGLYKEVVITHVNRVAVPTVEDFKRELDKGSEKEGEDILLTTYHTSRHFLYDSGTKSQYTVLIER